MQKVMRGRVLLALMIAFLTFFVSCHPRGQSSSPATPIEILNPTTPSTTNAPGVSEPGTGAVHAAQGTADSGGGNTFMGKPLESYKVVPKDLEAYKKIVAPILESQAIAGSQLGRFFHTILDKKIWYLIPAELKKISQEKIGSAVGVDQAALQDFNQIWINSLIFDKMSLKDQAVLIVHEILMGIRLLKLDSERAECMASQPADSQFCLNNSSEKVRGRPSDLTESDYAQIRSATAQIIEGGAKLTQEQWDNIFDREGFVKKAPIKTISLADLSEMIQTTKLMKTWPIFGYDLSKIYNEKRDLIANLKKGSTPLVLKYDQPCEVDIHIGKEGFSITLNENGKKVTYGSKKMTSSIDMSLLEDSLIGYSVYYMDSPPLKSKDSATKGDQVAYVTLKFLGKLLLGIAVQKTICFNDDCSEDGQGLNGFNLLCYTQPSLTFKSEK